MVVSYGLRTDSGGAGKFRGGLGSRRVLHIEAPEMRASLLMDHAKSGPWSLLGGSSGTPARVTVKKAGDTTFRPFTEAFGTTSASKFADVRLHEGDEVCIESCGGAGYGDPSERGRDLVERDVAEGFVSQRVASLIYGAARQAPVNGRQKSPSEAIQS
jgi:N-methylhydantoinase B